MHGWAAGPKRCVEARAAGTAEIPATTLREMRHAGHRVRGYHKTPEAVWECGSMVDTYDVFRKEGNQKVLWIGAADSIKKVKELIAKDPRPTKEYIVQNLGTGMRTVVPSDQSKRPA